MEETFIVGVDCAVDPAKVGVAAGFADSRGLRVLSAQRCSKKNPPSEVILGLLNGKSRALIALDSPLGWPASLGSDLNGHQAGDFLGTDPELLFRRGTDRFVKQNVGQRSLDVGADRIARTAAATLRILAEVREGLGHDIPLAWDPEIGEVLTAIEIYPAATLKARSIDNRGYKDNKKHRPRRQEILDAVSPEMTIACDPERLLENADVLDSALCVLAGCDFLQGRCFSPPDLAQAKEEGWIWVRGPVP